MKKLLLCALMGALSLICVATASASSSKVEVEYSYDAGYPTGGGSADVLTVSGATSKSNDVEVYTTASDDDDYALAFVHSESADVKVDSECEKVSDSLAYCELGPGSLDVRLSYQASNYGDDFTLKEDDEYIFDYVSVSGGSKADSIDVTGLKSNSQVNITAAGGADEIATANGKDYIYGGDGNDTIVSSLPGSTSGWYGYDGKKLDYDYVYGGDGNDTIDSGDGIGHIEAGAGDDDVTAGADGDEIDLGSGTNTLSSGGGSDTVLTGSGDNEVDLGAGDDTIHTSSGSDKVTAGAGSDHVYTQAGDDRVKGDDGNDYIYTSGGKDDIEGGAGDDSVNAGDDADVLLGDSGADTLSGGAGDDIFSAVDDERDSVYGSTGTDTALVDLDIDYRSSIETEAEGFSFGGL